jgi:hypothetical protein
MEDKSYTVENFVTTEFMTDGPEYGQLVTKMLTTSPRTELMNSFLTRFNYGYKEKYIATVTFRADGSSKFAEGQRYGYFPSFSLAWRMMEENFIKNMDLFSNLKLRAGWGQTGNQAIRPYQTMRTYKVGGYSNYDNSIGKTFVPNNIANPDLTWETTTQTNVGLDMGFFNNRLCRINNTINITNQSISIINQIINLMTNQHKFYSHNNKHQNCKKFSIQNNFIQKCRNAFLHFPN